MHPLPQGQGTIVKMRWIRQTLAGTRALARGVMVCVLIAITASFITEHHGGPVLLYALLLGLAFNFLNEQPGVAHGVGFCARTLLRLGVALLGARMTLGQVMALGAPTAWLTVAGVTLAVATGLLLAHRLRRPVSEGLLSGCAVGICGASAALAVSAVLPATRENERFTLLTVMGVTLMSTLAMIVYPLLVQAMAWSPTDAGIFLGATIHDVAQVVGAASTLGPEAADSAVIVKLLRVMLLTPVVMLIVLFQRQHTQPEGQATSIPILPGFLIGFISLMLLASAGLLPSLAVSNASDVSRGMLVLALSAAGVKTNVREIVQLGWQPAAMIVAETIVLAVFIALGMFWFRML